jgi:ankyrin repeat protein
MACSTGEHIDVVRYLLEKGADVTHVDEEGWTPLHFAARSGNKETIRLIKSALDGNGAAERGWSWGRSVRAQDKVKINTRSRCPRASPTSLNTDNSVPQ